MSFPVYIRSSTYTLTLIYPPLVFLVNKVCSCSLILKSSNLLNQALKACLSPYSALYSLYTKCSWNLFSYPWGWATYTSSVKSPCKKGHPIAKLSNPFVQWRRLPFLLYPTEPLVHTLHCSQFQPFLSKLLLPTWLCTYQFSKFIILCLINPFHSSHFCSWW